MASEVWRRIERARKKETRRKGIITVIAVIVTETTKGIRKANAVLKQEITLIDC